MNVVLAHLGLHTPSQPAVLRPVYRERDLAHKNVFCQHPVQGYLAHEKQPPRRTRQQNYVGPYGVPREGGMFLTSEVPLYTGCRGVNLRSGDRRIICVRAGGTVGGVEAAWG